MKVSAKKTIPVKISLIGLQNLINRRMMEIDMGKWVTIMLRTSMVKMSWIFLKSEVQTPDKTGDNKLFRVDLMISILIVRFFMMSNCLNN